MRAGHVWLATFAFFPLVGAPLLKHPVFRRFGLVSRVVLAGGIGMVIVSWTMTVFALAGVRWGPPLILVSVVVAFALRLTLSGGSESVPSPRERGEGPGEGRAATPVAALAIIAVSLLAALAATVAARSTSLDLLLFWGPKAQQFAAARTIDVKFLTAPYIDYMHVYYPPLVTNVFALGAMVAGRFAWGAATLTFPLLLAATAFGLPGIVRTAARSPAAYGTTALVVSALSLLGIHASVAGNAEPFLLFFETLALALLLTPFARTAAGQLLAGLLLAGAAGAKVEALPFVGAAVVFFFIVEPAARRSPGPTLARLLGPAALSLLPWFAFGASRKLFYGYYSYGRFLEIHWEHFGSVLSGFGTAFWNAGYALPFVVPFVVLLLTRGKTRRAIVPLGVAVALAAFFTFTYLHSGTDPRVWIGWSAARIFSPLTVLFALAAHTAAQGADGVEESSG
ncbi:MAG TPA: hypothetical protein VNC59_05480 [Thermoanaerobaculia bacterium]|nr:hypothetical protein [Thermoanaerobaculia bacterium]